ncbi:ribosome maturation factor RimM [Chloroflexota bacterium]
MKSSKPKFITIGKVLAPWGIKGKLKIEVATDFPERFASSTKVYVNRQHMTIENTAWQKGKAIIKLNTIDSIEDADKLRGHLLEIEHGQLYSLPEGQYYHFQLIGLEVRTTRGELLGNITEILTAPGNDTYVISGTKGEILIPAVEDIIKSIDLKEGCLIIEPIEGLLNLNKKPAD